MVGDAAELLHIAEPHQKITASFLAALARVQSATGQPDLAKATIAKALELDPKYPDALTEKARQDGNAGDWRAAVESLQKVVPPRTSVLRNLVFAALQIDDLQTAHDAAVDLYEFNPDSPENALALSVVLVRASHWGEARPLLEKVLAAHPEDKRAQLALGIVQYNLGNLDQATQLLTASLGQGAADSEARYMLGLVAKQRGDMPAAAREMELALAGSPDKPEALASLGQLYLQLNDTGKARTILEKAVDKLPNDPQTHYQLGLAYRKLNLNDKAREQTEIFQKLSVRKIPQPTGESPDSHR
jgi:tetratricopeptide (TPR) repeat protein